MHRSWALLALALALGLGPAAAPGPWRTVEGESRGLWGEEGREMLLTSRGCQSCVEVSVSAKEAGMNGRIRPNGAWRRVGKGRG